MKITQHGSEILYVSDQTDWLFRVSIADDGSLRMELTSNGFGFSEHNGVSYEEIGPFIAAAKADLIARGLNWS